MYLHVSLSSHKNNFHTGVILLGDAKLTSFQIHSWPLENYFFKQYVSTILFSFLSISLLTCASGIQVLPIQTRPALIYSIRNYRRLGNEFKLGKSRVCWKFMISVIHLSYFRKFENTTLTNMETRFKQNNKTIVIRPHNDP